MSDSKTFSTLEASATPSQQIAVDCTALQGLCELPLGNELLDAKFTREGHDLLVNTQSKLVIAENYFTYEEAPTLISETGKKIGGNSINVLSSSEAPKEYAGTVTSQPSIGTVEKLEGSVTVKRGGVDIELKQGDTVFQDDVIQTATDGKIGITFEDGSVFTLGSEARMTLDSFVYDAETGDGSSSINVIKGMFKFVSGEIAANNPGEMQVETPVATIGIRGTTGGGSVQGEGMDNEFYLEPNADGTVGWFDVTTDQGTTSMNQPNTVLGIQSFNQAPPAPQFVAPEQIHKSFADVVNFAPAGKYEARENSEHQDKSGAQEAAPEEGTAEEAAAEATPEAKEAEAAGEEAPEEEEKEVGASEEHSAAETDEEATELEASENTEEATEIEAEAVEAAVEQPAPADEEAQIATPQPINTTLSGENSETSAFEQAQQAMDGQTDGLPQDGTPHADAAAEANAQPMAVLEEVLELASAEEAGEELDLAEQFEATLDEQVEDSRDALVDAVLNQPQPDAPAAAPNTPDAPATDGPIDNVTDANLSPIPLPEEDDEETDGAAGPDAGDNAPAVGNAPAAGSVPAFGSGGFGITNTLTSSADSFAGTTGDDTAIVDLAASFDPTNDSLFGGDGVDTLRFDIATADVSGLANTSGFERIELTQNNSTLIVNQAFVDQRSTGAPGIEVDFGANNITATLTGLADDNSGVMLNGTGLVTFSSTAGGTFHQAINKDDVSINFDLNTNNAAGEFELHGGENTVSGGSRLSINQQGGHGHQFTLGSGDNEIELTNVNADDAGNQTTISGAANDLYLDIEGSRNIYSNASSSSGLHASLTNSYDATIFGGASADDFHLTGDGSGIELKGNGGGDKYHFSNFSGEATLETKSNDSIFLHTGALNSGADVKLDFTSGANSSIIETNIDFNSLSLSLNSGIGGQDLTLSSAGKDVTLLHIDDAVSKYEYHEHGIDLFNNLGVRVDKDVRDLHDAQYTTTSLYNAVSGVFSNSGTSTSAGNMALIEGSVMDDTIMTTGAFQKVETHDGNDIISVQASTVTVGGGNERTKVLAGGGNDIITLGNTVDYVTVDGGDGFDILDASSISVGVTLSASGLTFGANTYVSSHTDIEGFITGIGADNITGTANNEVFNAGAGGDNITGGGGTDTVSYATSGAAVNVDLGVAGTQSGGDAAGDVLSGIKNLIGSTHDDVLKGDSSDNELIGGAGDDTLDGNGGNDTIYGGIGDDDIDGGAGTDTVSYEHSLSGVNVNLITGDVTGQGSDSLNNIENITGSHHNDVLIGNGNAQIMAGHGDDILILDTTVYSGGFANGQQGFDTLKIIDMSGAADLAALEYDFTGLEKIDLTGAAVDLGNVTAGVIDNIDDGNHQFFIEGDGDDNITLSSSTWAYEGEENGYSIYFNASSGIEVATAGITVDNS